MITVKYTIATEKFGKIDRMAYFKTLQQASRFISVLKFMSREDSYFNDFEVGVE